MANFEEEHVDPTGEITLDTVKARAVKGVFALTGRTFIFSVISLAATGLLGVFLDPNQYGVFLIVSAVTNFMAYFSDVGLAAALIQKKEEVSSDELKTTFAIQQTIVLTLLAGLVAFTPLITKYYALTQEGRYLLYALGFSLLLSSLKTIPSVLLERELQFGKLVLPQVFENLVFNIVLVFLAWKGFGIESFTYAVLIRGIFGLIAIYILRPWVPGIAFSREPIRRLLKYGLPYQANSLLATIKDDGVTLFLGGILGPAGMGYLGWAQKWGQAPLRFFMDHVLKVTFPAFSRMQHNKKELERSLTKSILFICFLVFPSIVGLVIVSPFLVKLIPRYEKWTPALLPLALIGINTAIAAATTQLTNLFNSIGKIKLTFRLMIMWTTLTWLLVPYLSRRFGVTGAAAGYALVSCSSVVAVILAKKYVNFSITKSILSPLVATLVMGAVLLSARSQLDATYFSLWTLIGLGFIVYMLASYILIGRRFMASYTKYLSKKFWKK